MAKAYRSQADVIRAKKKSELKTKKLKTKKPNAKKKSGKKRR
jgi:hypothetical protein